jgi:PadR family transcriptional regulator PadR
MRRRAGSLVPLELAICTCALELQRQGIDTFHGYEIAKRLASAAERRLLTAYGTLYRALSRLEQMGMLRSEWEAPEIAARERRPGRRLYTLTGAGAAAAQESLNAPATKPATRGRRRWQPA